MPDVEVSFATSGLDFAELEGIPFAEVLAVIELVTGGEVRETVATEVGTLAFVPFTNNPACVVPFACFPTGSFACDDVVG